MNELWKNILGVTLGICGLFLIAITITGGEPAEYTVTSIHDGDTIYVRIKGKDEKIRLAEIDAPELKQSYGNKSTDVLFRKIYYKQVRLEFSTHKDVHDRPLAKIYIKERYINGEMVKEGYAWDYHQYSHNKELAKLQEEAKSKKLGLWKDPKPIPPWEFRKKSKRTKNDQACLYNLKILVV